MYPAAAATPYPRARAQEAPKVFFPSTPPPPLCPPGPEEQPSQINHSPGWEPGGQVLPPPPTLSHHQLKPHPTPTGMTFSAFLAEFLCLGEGETSAKLRTARCWSQSQLHDSLRDPKVLHFFGPYFSLES